jgi:hypothetical protein
MLGVFFAECRFAARGTFSEHASLFTIGRLLVQKMFVIFCTEDAVKPRFIVGFRIRLVFREKCYFILVANAIQLFLYRRTIPIFYNKNSFFTSLIQFSSLIISL